MIYIVTEMEKKPSTCKQCPLSDKMLVFGKMNYCCTVLHRVLSDISPLDCPLVEIKET